VYFLLWDTRDISCLFILFLTILYFNRCDFSSFDFNLLFKIGQISQPYKATNTFTDCITCDKVKTIFTYAYVY